MLEAKADINSKYLRFGQTPLFLAAKKGHGAVVKILLEANANIESEDSYDQTPLMLAAENGHEAVVKLLLEAKADANSKDLRFG